MLIVRPNSPERLAELPWLLRDENGTSREVRSIFAQDVCFLASPDPDEIGFGEGIVAECKSAAAWATEDTARHGEVKIQFAGVRFETVDGRAVYSCQSLRFTRSGSMYPTLGLRGFWWMLGVTVVIVIGSAIFAYVY
jgi:hypothetical protein